MAEVMRNGVLVLVPRKISDNVLNSIFNSFFHR